MQDNALIQAFLPIISAGLASQGYLNIPIVQAYQPTQQGINSSATIYFYKVNDYRYGYVKREDNWDSNTSTMIHTETQLYETIFQINALVIQDPINISYTASDLINVIAAIMQSENTLTLLQQQDIQILRITDVRNPYFSDDKDRFEASPSFDFTLLHKQIITTNDNVIQTVVPGIYRI
jgi:hypothetical protein